MRHGWSWHSHRVAKMGLLQPCFLLTSVVWVHIKVHRMWCETEQKFRYCSRDKVTIKKAILRPKRWIIIKRISLFGNKRELEQISCGRFSAILANLWSHLYIIHGAPAQNLSDAPSVTSTFRHYSWPRLPTEPPVYRTRLHKDKQGFFDNYMMIALLISRKFWGN